MEDTSGSGSQKETHEKERDAVPAEKVRRVSPKKQKLSRTETSHAEVIPEKCSSRN